MNDSHITGATCKHENIELDIECDCKRCLDCKQWFCKECKYHWIEELSNIE